MFQFFSYLSKLNLSVLAFLAICHSIFCLLIQNEPIQIDVLKVEERCIPVVMVYKQRNEMNKHLFYSITNKLYKTEQILCKLSYSLLSQNSLYLEMLCFSLKITFFSLYLKQSYSLSIYKLSISVQTVSPTLFFSFLSFINEVSLKLPFPSISIIFFFILNFSS